MTTTLPISYNAELARRHYPAPWLRDGEAVALCKKFGLSDYEWRRLKQRIPTNPNFTGTSWTRYDRDALIGVLQGQSTQ